jgi:WD40 repeat protein
VVNTSGGCGVFAYPDLALVTRLSGRNLGEGPGALFGPDSDCVVQGSWGGDLVVREIEHRTVVFTERNPGEMIQAIACNPDRDAYVYCVTRMDHAIVRVRSWPFEGDRGEDVVRLDGSESRVKALALDAAGHLALRTRAAVSVWELEGPARLADRDVGESGTQEDVAWSRDEEVATTGSEGAKMKQATGFSDRLEQRWSVAVPYACSLDYSPSGQLIAIGSWERGVVLRQA